MSQTTIRSSRLRRCPAIACLAAMALSCGLLAQTPGKYADVRSTTGTAKIKPVFVPLPPGAVSPKGWLRDWALDAANGITGHLDEYSATFGEAWKGHPFSARGARPDGTGWPLEQSSYWLDGAVRLAYILDDKALIQKVSKRLDMVVSGVLDGGETFIYWRPKSALSTGRSDFNSLAHSHMGRALVAYYQATGDARILKALVKVYRDFPLPGFKNGFDDVSGAVNIDPMVETYLMSGDRAVLDRAVEYAGRKTYTDVAARWLRSDLPYSHGAIFYENIRVPALLYPWTGNKDDLTATLKAIAWLDQHHTLPMGLSSSEEYHAGIGATRNVETCNVAASMWTYLWMLRITGDASYSDRIEKVFFNAGPAPAGRDFKTMCYYQSPNRYSTALPEEEPQNPGAQSYRFTNIGHSVLCCVGNLNRVIPNYVMHMWMATMDRGIAATLYGPSEVRARVAGGVPVQIHATTTYPFEETVTLTITPEKEVAFPLYLRIPAWCGNPEIRVNGKTVHPVARQESFVKIERSWRADDRVTLRFPMRVVVVKGRETSYPQIPYFAKGRTLAKVTGIDSPYSSVYLGPLLFAVPIPDDGPNQEVPGSHFNYALDVRPDQAARKIQVIRHPMPVRWTWSLDAPVQLSVKVKEFPWQPTEHQPLPKDVVTAGKSAKILLVPYGCTKFRVSMLPVTRTTWANGR
jgi:uncharacterized protein